MLTRPALPGSTIDAKDIQRPLPGKWPHDGSWSVLRPSITPDADQVRSNLTSSGEVVVLRTSYFVEDTKRPNEHWSRRCDDCNCVEHFYIAASLDERTRDIRQKILAISG